MEPLPGIPRNVKVCPTLLGSTCETVLPSMVAVPPIVPMTWSKNALFKEPPESYWLIVMSTVVLAGSTTLSLE